MGSAGGLTIEGRNDCSFGLHHPHHLLNKRETPCQRRAGKSSMEHVALSNSPSRNESMESQRHPVNHLQFLPSYGERSPPPPPPPSSQQDNFAMGTITAVQPMESDTRHHQVSHLSSLATGDTLEPPRTFTPPISVSNNSSQLLSSDGGTSSNSSMKRTHGLNKPSANDPLSHRIIEKRRRDRMNNCLADLSRLIPTYYLKKGRGRIEKTEIIEMAIKYMKHLQAHACSQIETCEITTKQEKAGREMEQFQVGYQEAMSETLEFLRDSEGLFSGDSLCVRIMNHLTKHCEKIMKNKGYSNLKLNGSISSASSSSGYHANGSSNGSSSDGNGSGSNLGPDCKNILLTEESAYRSDDPLCSDDREMSYPSGEAQDGVTQGLSGGYLSSSGPGSNTSSSGDDNGNRLYKFKSNMKHRFSADAEHVQGKRKRKDSGSFSVYSDGDKECSRRSFGASSRQFPYAHYPPNHDGRVTPKSYSAEKINPHQISSGGPKTEVDSTPVPIFALCPGGTYYVPMSLDQSMLAPYLSAQSETVAPTPILHPVSIYVNFASAPLSSPQRNQYLSPIPPTPETIFPHRIDHYDAYGAPISRSEPRALRPPSGPLSELTHLQAEGVTHIPPDHRVMGGRHAIREYPGKFSGRGQMSWPYHIVPSYKE